MFSLFLSFPNTQKLIGNAKVLSMLRDWSYCFSQTDAAISIHNILFQIWIDCEHDTNSLELHEICIAARATEKLLLNKPQNIQLRRDLHRIEKMHNQSFTDVYSAILYIQPAIFHFSDVPPIGRMYGIPLKDETTFRLHNIELIQYSHDLDIETGSLKNL